jgi:hypothetical protein
MEAKEEYIPIFFVDDNVIVANIDVGHEWCGILFDPVWLSNYGCYIFGIWSRDCGIQ